MATSTSASAAHDGPQADEAKPLGAGAVRDSYRAREERKSYQFRALSRKSCSYQKRQMFTNICCISCCPLMMVLISYILGSVLQRLITKSSKAQEFLFCSNLNATDPTTGLPISDTNALAFWGRENYTGPAIAAATYDTETKAVRHANYFSTSTSAAFGQTGPGTSAASLIGVAPCERWLGAIYPDTWTIPNEPFDSQVNRALPELVVRDTAFRSEPTTGWLGAVIDPAKLYPQLLQYQSLPWSLVYRPSSLSSVVGAKPATTYSVNLGVQGLGISATVDPAKSSTGSLPPRYGPANNATDSGMLSRTANRFYLSNMTFPDALLAAIASGGSQGATAFFAGGGRLPIELRTAPYFSDVSSRVDSTAASTYAGDAAAAEKALDDEIGAILSNAVFELARLDKTALLQGNASTSAALAYINQAAALVNKVPMAGLAFNKVDFSGLQFDVLVQAGTDKRVASSSTLLPMWFRNLLSVTDLSNMIIKELGARSSSTPLIAQGFRHFPSYANTALSLPIASLIGRILYPWGVSFLLPIFVIAIVKEKEDRIAVMMKMNGLKPSTYYITQYLQFLILAILSSIVFLIVGSVLRMEMFRLTGGGVLPVLFFVWCNVQVALAFFFSAFFSKNRTALIMTFLIVLCSVVISLALETLYTDTLSPVFFIWPPFAFYRCLAKINTASWRKNLRPYELSALRPPDEVGVALVFMILEIPIYLAIGYYLGQVLPSEYGVRRPFWFPITDLIKLIRGGKKATHGETDLSDNNVAGKGKENANAPVPVGRQQSSHLVAIPEEDDDVRQERERVVDGRFDMSTTPLYMRGMRKVYESRGGKGPKVAVKDITVAVEEGRVFGLLGPNGAGKTTLISILTGIYPPTAGEAVIAGFNIRTNMSDVYKRIGVCPQHDILWDDLTVEEHLLFYARLKGVPAAEEQEAVLNSMRTVSLENFATRLSKGLSGGEKRRLSIAIALVGNPACVFLDEPTTGLDPEVRRAIWNIIDKARVGKTIVLTTHSMEEAEVLCQRIAIMSHGSMRCIGSVLRLKQLYGSGFKLTFAASVADMSRATQFVESLLPAGDFERIDSFSTTAAYEFKPAPGLVGQLFEILQRESSKHGIVDWGLSQTSLEEVFLEIISDDDANAD